MKTLRCLSLLLPPVVLLFSPAAHSQAIVGPGVRPGTVTTSPVGSGAAGRCALFNGATTITSDPGCLFTGTGATFVQNVSSLQTPHLLGTSAATEGPWLGGGFTNQPAGLPVDLQSSDAGDTAVVVRVYGRDNGTGALIYEDATLNGLNQVALVGTYSHVLGVKIVGGTALGTVLVYKNAAPADAITTIVPPATSAGIRAVTLNPYNRAVTITGVAPSSAYCGIEGTDTAGNPQFEIVQFNDATPVPTTKTWGTVTFLYLGAHGAGKNSTISSLAAVDVTTPLFLPNGSAGTPALGLTAYPGVGFFFGGTYAAFTTGSGKTDSALGHGIALPSDGCVTYSDSTTNALSTAQASVCNTAGVVNVGAGNKRVAIDASGVTAGQTPVISMSGTAAAPVMTLTGGTVDAPYFRLGGTTSAYGRFSSMGSSANVSLDKADGTGRGILYMERLRLNLAYGGTGAIVQVSDGGANTPALHMVANRLVAWASSTSNAEDAKDLGLSRAAAGTLAVGNGTAGDSSGTVRAAAADGNAIVGRSYLAQLTSGYGGAGDYGFYLNQTTTRLASGMAIQWSSTTDAYNGAKDLGLSRSAAGVLAVGNGTAGDASGSLVTRNYQVSLVADGTLQYGSVVAPSGTPGRFTFNNTSGDLTIGVLAGTGPSSAGNTYGVIVSGIAHVIPAVNQSVSAADHLCASATLGATVDTSGGTLCTPGQQIGKSIATEAPDVLVSATAGTDQIVLTSAPGWAVDDPVVFHTAGGAAIAGLTTANVYWIKTIAGATVTLSGTKGGTTTDITADGVITTQYLQRLPLAVIHIF